MFCEESISSKNFEFLAVIVGKVAPLILDGCFLGLLIFQNRQNTPLEVIF